MFYVMCVHHALIHALFHHLSAAMVSWLLHQGENITQPGVYLSEAVIVIHVTLVLVDKNVFSSHCRFSSILVTVCCLF